MKHKLRLTVYPFEIAPVFMKVLCLVLASFLFSSYSGKTLVTITITNLRNAEGLVGLGFYKDQKSFDDEDEFLLKKFSKDQMKNGVLTVKVSLEPGTYGIAMLDDENANGEMDYSWLMPTEGFGFSNYYHTGLTKPDLEQFDFVVGNEPTQVSIKVKYL